MPTWLILSWLLRLAYTPQDDASLGCKAPCLDTSKHFEQTLGLSAEAFGHLRIETDIRTSDFAESGLRFNPYSVDYGLSLELFGRGWKLFWRHDCIHDVISEPKQLSSWMSNKTSIGLELSGNF